MPYENSQNAGRKILSAVSKDRVITKFPQAFHSDATPHQKINFSSQVKSVCSEGKTGTVGLKICKAVLVGDVAVGKTSLCNRFCHNVFDRDYKATIGVDFEVEKFSVLSVPFTVQIWDTAGQERFKCIAASYYRGSNLVMVVFDLSDVESLSHARRWAEEACENATDPMVFLVGTKKDLVSPATYEDVQSQAVQLANDIGAEYWALSSKTGENVREFFLRAVALTFDTLILREVDSPQADCKKIGSDFIKVEKKNDDIYEKSNRRPKCCS